MQTLRLALAQANPTVGDIKENASKAISFVHEAERWGADLVALPEMVITGYPPHDLLLKQGFVLENIEKMEFVATKTKNICALYGFVDKKGDRIYNSAAFACNGKVIGIYHKLSLSRNDFFDETRYFSPGESLPIFDEIAISIGDELFKPDGQAMPQFYSGAKLIIILSASPYYVGKPSFIKKALSKLAADHEVFIAYTNMVGGQDELVFDGASMVFDPEGRLISMGKQFEEDLIIVDIELERAKGPKKKSIGLKAERFKISLPSKVDRPKIQYREIKQLEPTSELYQALVLGIRDYARKNGFEKAVIGLSGGIDSSLAASIAVDALGSENVIGVSMPSPFSSKEGVEDVKRLCSNLGIRLLSLPINKVFDAFLETLKETFEGTGFGVAEENIQARARANILMALSNKFGWLVLTTGNRSELSTGYVTLGGDMLGGFAVLKDVPKTIVYELARYRNRIAGREVIPRSVLEREPSAELRPGQKDSDTLPPYEILDPILKAYIDDGKSPSEIISLGFPEEVVRRVIMMVNRSEFKRRQGPVGVKITQKEMRLPITNRFHEI